MPLRTLSNHGEVRNDLPCYGYEYRTPLPDQRHYHAVEKYTIDLTRHGRSSRNTTAGPPTTQTKGKPLSFRWQHNRTVEKYTIDLTHHGYLHTLRCLSVDNTTEFNKCEAKWINEWTAQTKTTWLTFIPRGSRRILAKSHHFYNASWRNRMF